MTPEQFEQQLICDSIEGRGPLAEVYHAGVNAMDLSEFYKAVRQRKEAFRISQIPYSDLEGYDKDRDDAYGEYLDRRYDE
ncbi:hypothetical protein KGP36_01800 [Patescibacteria group bacterium]|nr:hypothetical protein [Patescibacteria group bacterium]